MYFDDILKLNFVDCNTSIGLIKHKTVPPFYLTSYKISFFLDKFFISRFSSSNFNSTFANSSGFKFLIFMQIPDESQKV